MSEQAGQAAGAASNGATPPQADGFVALDEDSIKEYVAAQPDLAKRLGDADTVGQWTVRLRSSSHAASSTCGCGPESDLESGQVSQNEGYECSQY